MQDRAHELAERAEQRRQTIQDQGPEAARQQRMRREGGGITEAEQRRLSETQAEVRRRDTR